MGFLSSEKITVGSAAFNLAGDVKSRDNFMKNNILHLIFSGASKRGIGKGIVDAHIAGPATSYSRFAKWAETSGYNTQVGNLTGLLYSANTLSTAGFEFLVPVKATHDQRAITFSSGILNINLIALEWIINNSPANRDKVFSASLEMNTIVGASLYGTTYAPTGKVLIKYADGSAETFTSGFNLNSTNIYAYLYHEQRKKLSQVITDTEWVTLVSPETPPSRATFVAGTITVIEDGVSISAVVTASGTPVIVAQIIPRTKTTTTITSYSNSTPTNTSVATAILDLNFNKITGNYTKIITVTATPTIKGKVTTLVQDEESFYRTLYTSSTSSSSEVIQQTSGSNLYVVGAANTYITSTGVIVTPSPSTALSITGKVPISSGQTLRASSGPGGAGWGYVALYNASDVYIAGSATDSNVISHMAGATYARFTYFTANSSGYTIYQVVNVTVTTTVTTETPYLDVYWKYKQVTTVVKKEKWEPPLLKIYQQGTSVLGDSLLFSSAATARKFFPVIPLRRFNTMVNNTNFPTQYSWNRKAAKKCFGTKKKYDSLLASLEENPDVIEIDHAWVVFGVSLSTQQQDGQKYLYEFFKNLSDTTSSTAGAHKSPSAFSTAWATFVTAVGLSTNDESGGVSRPLPPTAQQYAIAINATGGTQNWEYNMTITGKGGGQVVGTGYHVKSKNKVGYCWVYQKDSITVSIPIFTASYDEPPTLDYVPSTTAIIAFGKQLTETTWEEYEFYDLIHTNLVYEGVATDTLATTAIASVDENSSFVIPLHEDVFKNMNLVRKTQLSLECAFLVINYYNKQKIPWYASGFFQIIVVIIIIVIAVYTGYIGPESAGLFGTNVAVGTSLGFTGAAAVIAGAIANAVAAAIVSALITKVAVRALGEDVGRIVGFIASMITINLMSSTGPFNLADSWAQMTRADNLIKLTMSGVQQYGVHLQNEAMEVNAKTQALMLESNAALKEINRLTQELMGDTGVNPTTITDALRYATENPAQFFSRTTMTGTDIAQLSLSLVEDFPAPQLALPYLD